MIVQMDLRHKMIDQILQFSFLPGTFPVKVLSNFPKLLNSHVTLNFNLAKKRLAFSKEFFSFYD